MFVAREEFALPLSDHPYFFFHFHAAGLCHLFFDEGGECQEIGRRCPGLVNQEIGMDLGYLGPSHLHSAHSGLLDEAPGLVAGRVLENDPALG